MNILLVTDGPLSDKHAGGLRLIRIYSIIKQLNPSVHLYQLSILREPTKIEVIAIFEKQFSIQVNEQGAQKNFQQFLSGCDVEFSIVELSSVQVYRFLSCIRRYQSDADIILTLMESQVRACGILLPRFKPQNIKHWKRLVSNIKWALYELYYIYQSDLSITVSIADYEVLKSFNISKKKLKNLTTFEPNILKTGTVEIDATQSNATKKVIIFFAYFGSKTNIESLRWFIEKVHIDLCKLHPDYKLHICGAGITPELTEYLSCFEQIVIVGEVENIDDALLKHTIGIAPALSGSGVRGKIHQYSSYFMATVATSIATEGLQYIPNKSILIADDEKNYFDCCNFLLENSSLRIRIASGAFHTYQRYYTEDAIIADLRDVYRI